MIPGEKGIREQDEIVFPSVAWLTRQLQAIRVPERHAEHCV